MPVVKVDRAIAKEYEKLSNMLVRGQTSNGFTERLNDFFSKTAVTNEKEQALMDDLRAKALAKGIPTESKADYRKILISQLDQLGNRLEQLKQMPKALGKNVTLEEATDFYQANAARMVEAERTEQLLQTLQNGQEPTKEDQRIAERYDDIMPRFRAGLANLNKGIEREAEKFRQWAQQPQEYLVAM